MRASSLRTAALFFVLFALPPTGLWLAARAAVEDARAIATRDAIGSLEEALAKRVREVMAYDARAVGSLCASTIVDDASLRRTSALLGAEVVRVQPGAPSSFPSDATDAILLAHARLPRDGSPVHLAIGQGSDASVGTLCRDLSGGGQSGIMVSRRVVQVFDSAALGVRPPFILRTSSANEPLSRPPFFTLPRPRGAALGLVLDRERDLWPVRSVDLAGGGALLFVLLLAIYLARRMDDRAGESLRAIETAARSVAGGNLDTKITLSPGGSGGDAAMTFNHMTQELRRTRERLLRAERIAAWRDIARRIAHEIKNPLSPIQVSIETMRKTYAKGHPDFPEIFEESTQTILEEVERLKRIVSEFSEFARLPKPRPAPVDATDVVEHVVGLHSTGLGDASEVRVRSELVGGPTPTVRADREQLTQVFVNLVQNAIDAAREAHPRGGGEVVVRVRRAGDGVEIAVEDNGRGIADADRARVFEPYFTTKAAGTGLGLAIVHRIVSDHGGTIDIGESTGGGAAFLVTLTAAGPPAEADATQSRP